jgi:hypothetical protein
MVIHRFDFHGSVPSKKICLPAIAFESFSHISFGFLLDLDRISERIPKEIQKKHKINMLQAGFFFRFLNILQIFYVHSVCTP